MRTDRGILAFSPCPACGARGRRVRIVERRIQHIALGRRAWIVARVGVMRMGLLPRLAEQLKTKIPEETWKKLRTGLILAESTLRKRPIEKITPGMKTDPR